MQNARLDEPQAGVKIARRNINNLRWTTHVAESKEELKSLLMKVREESKKAGLKLNIQKIKIMPSDPITSWQMDGDKWKQWQTLFLDSGITADGDCSHEIKRHLLLGRKAMTNLDSILKSRDITLPTEVHLVKAMVFPVVRYGCESWTQKKSEHQRIDAFELWCWRRLLRVLWTAKRSIPVHTTGNQSWIFIGRTNAKAETPILWPPNAENWLIWKDPAWFGERLRVRGEGDDRRWVVGWHHWLSEDEFE